MSIKCKNKVFDSNAYLKISIIERPQQDIVDKLTQELKEAKQKYGNKGFNITCLECGSGDCSVRTDSDYGFDGEEEYLIDLGQYIECNNCGNREDV